MDFTLSFALFMLLGLYFRTFNYGALLFCAGGDTVRLRYVLKQEYSRIRCCLYYWRRCSTRSVLVVIPLYLIAALPWKKWQVALGRHSQSTSRCFRGSLDRRWCCGCIPPTRTRYIICRRKPGWREARWASSAAPRCWCWDFLPIGETIKENRANLLF